jgi:transposase
MRFIGLDVHRDFCEVAIAEDGKVRSAGRIKTTPDELELFGGSLGATDEVALEATGVALGVARILKPHVARVVVVKPDALPDDDRQRAKTDRRDDKALARLLAQGYLKGVWVPDEDTRQLRRRTSRRAQLTRQRTRAKNETHAALVRTLAGKAPVSDVFGKGGREWLSDLELPADERETVEGCLRQIDFLDQEIEALDRAIARQAVGSPEIKRLMTIPGVDVITASALHAAIGDVGRFESPRHLVAYLGLDPKVRQSGSQEARLGRISKRGSRNARRVLGEAAWVAIESPGPLRAFFERLQARRGKQIAIVAVARKLAALSWHLLTREQDYAFGRPSLTRRKLRRLELRAGAPRRKPGRRPAALAKAQYEREERELQERAEIAYRKLVADWQAKGKKGAGATSGARILKASIKSRATRQEKAPDPAL